MILDAKWLQSSGSAPVTGTCRVCVVVDVWCILFFICYNSIRRHFSMGSPVSDNAHENWYMNAGFSTYISRSILSIIALGSVVSISLGQVLLQELQVLLGSSSDTLLSGSGSGNIGGGGVELGELGGKIRRQSGCLRSGRGGVRLDAGKVSVGVLQRAKYQFQVPICGASHPSISQIAHVVDFMFLRNNIRRSDCNRRIRSPSAACHSSSTLSHEMRRTRARLTLVAGL